MPRAMKRDATVGDLMRKWRGLVRMNTAAAGERFGLSSRAIEDIEQGRRRDGDELTRIALLQLIYEAAHERNCRDAALAAVAEREKKVGDRKNTR